MRPNSSLFFLARLFGVIMGAMSLFSLCHDYYQFGIRPLAKRLLDAYHSFVHPIANQIQVALERFALLFALQIPKLPKDAIIFYIFVTACLIRAFHIWRYYDAKQLSFKR
jgi:hypothetical protein